MRSKEYSYERMVSNLEMLGMKAIQERIDGVLERAVRDEMAVVEVLDELFEIERQTREASSRAHRLKVSGLPYQKRISDFDFSFQPSIDERLVRDLCTLRFVHNAENIVILGPPGVGKSHLSVGLALEAIDAGMMVYFTTAMRLIDRLQKAVEKRTLDRKLKAFRKYRILVIDELGYLPLKSEGAHLLFQVVSTLYEHSSIIITSNLSFGEWGGVLGDHLATAAILDRLMHHSVLINIRGESYRLKDKMHGPNPFRITHDLMKK